MVYTSAPTQYWLVFQDNCMLLAKNQRTPLLTTIELSSIATYFFAQHQFATFHHHQLFCTEISIDCSLPPSLISIPFKKALELIDHEWYHFAVKAYAIINWDKNNQYCGRCGGKTIHQSNIFERVCSKCSLPFYPRISPSIIVRITKGTEILMARGNHFAPGVYALIAGFIEVGENIEEAIHREVKEEVGIEINHLQYFGSQSWPFPDSLMIAFTAEYAGGELIIDKTEIEEAGWYHYDNLPGKPSNSISIAGQLIDDFVKDMTCGK